MNEAGGRRTLHRRRKVASTEQSGITLFKKDEGNLATFARGNKAGFQVFVLFLSLKVTL